MKKNSMRWISIVLITAFCFTLFHTVSFSAVEKRPLSNTIYRLKNKMPLTIGYLGGSITLGSGASAEKNNYRAKTTKWFTETYPQSTITEINAGIGGFGSIPNVFRAKSQLLVKNPDLVFVEAAVNDWGGNEKEIKDSMEGVIRQIYENNPKTDIVMIYTTKKDAAEASYASGQTMKTVAWHEEIAAHYGIVSINVGIELYEKVKKGEYSWEALLPDGTHPNDIGYEIYAKTIAQTLQNELSKPAPSGLADYKMPAKLHATCYDKADIADSWDMTYNGFEKSETSMGGRHPHMIISNKTGATASIAFKGRTVGLYWLKSNDAGIVEWWVDQDAPKTISGCDDLALSSSARGTFNILSTSLSEGEHVLNIRVTGEKSTGSKDIWARIGGVFVAEKSAIKVTTPPVPTTNPQTTSAPQATKTPTTVNTYVPQYGAFFKALGIQFATANESTVTRGEAAISIASMLKTEIEFVSGQIFEDVAANHPAYRAVSQLKSMGIISGSGGNFNPDTPITKDEAVKLLVSAVGYAPLANENGGYPAGYHSAASTAGILKGVDLSGGINPKVFEKLLYNTLDTDLFERTTYGNKIGYAVTEGVTILSKYHDVYSEKGVVTATAVTSLGGYLKAPKSSLRIGDTIYRVADYYDALLGHKVKYYYHDDKDQDASLIFVDSFYTDTKLYRSDDLVDYNSNTYTVVNDYGKNESIAVYAYADVIYNNKRMEKDEQYMKPVNGTVEMIDNNQDGIYEVFKIFDYTPFVVAGTDGADQVIYNLLASGDKLELTENNYRFVNTSGVEIGIEEISKFDVISVAQSNDGEYVSGIVARMYVQGTVDEIAQYEETKGIYINNMEYLLTPGYQKANEITIGSEVIFYLDHYENIVYCADSKQATTGYAYLINTVYTSDIQGNRVMLKVLDADGKIKVLSTKEKVFFNDDEVVAQNVFVQLQSYKGVINYSENDQKLVSRIYTAVGTDSTTKTGLYCDNLSGTEYYYRAASLNFGNKVIMSGNTVIFVIPSYSEDEENYKVISGSALKNSEYYMVAGYKTNLNRLTSDFVVWYEEGGDFNRYTTPITVVEKKVTILDERGFPTDKIYGTAKGKQVSYVSYTKGLFDQITSGDVIRCSVSSNGMVVKEPQIIYDYETHLIKVTIGANTSSSPWVLKGKVLQMDGDVVKFYTGSNPANPEANLTYYFTINDKKAITEYDGTKESNRITAASRHHIKDYESSGDDCSEIIAVLNYGEHEELIIIK